MYLANISCQMTNGLDYLHKKLAMKLAGMSCATTALARIVDSLRRAFARFIIYRYFSSCAQLGIRSVRYRKKMLHRDIKPEQLGG